MDEVSAAVRRAFPQIDSQRRGWLMTLESQGGGISVKLENARGEVHAFVVPDDVDPRQVVEAVRG